MKADRPAATSNGDDRTDWESISEQIMAELSPSVVPGYAAPPQVSPTVAPVLIGAVADAIATLYLAYKVGNRIDDIADGIVNVLSAVADVAKAVANLTNKLADVMDAIERAVAVLSRKVDTALMQQDVSDANAALARIQTRVSALQKLPPDLNEPVVAQLLDELRGEESKLYYSIIRFMGQESPVPSQASLITCAAPIGAWAQVYTLLQRYSYADAQQRIGVWDTAEHSLINRYITAHFDDVAATRARMDAEMNSSLLIPTALDAYFFKNGLFIDPVPFQYSYSTGGRKSYDKLFAFVPGSLDGLQSTVLVAPTFPSSQFRWGWRPLSGGYQQFSDPKHCQDAHSASNAKSQLREQYIEYLENTKDSEVFRGEYQKAIAKPPTW